MKKILNELINRWKSESPKFWKIIMKYSLILATIASSIIGADKIFDLQSYGVNETIFTICGYILTAAAAMGLTAKLTKE